MPLTTSQPLSRTTRLAIAALGMTQIIGWGSTYYLLTMLGRPIASELGLSSTLVAGGLSIMLVMGAVLGPMAGRAMDMHGARPIMAAGSCLAAIGLTALSFVIGPVSYIAAWLLIGLASPLILYPAAFTALTQIAPAQARRAITWLTLPGGLASTIYWPLTDALLTHYTWREVCLIYAALNVLVCLPLHLSLSRSPDGLRQTDETATASSTGLPGPARRAAAVLFAGALAFNALLITGLLNQFIPIMRELGQQPAHAVMLGMAFGMAQTSARFLEILSGARIDSLVLGLMTASGFPIALLVLGSAPASLIAGFVFAAVFGACNGLWTIVRGAVVLRLFGTAGYGENLGTVIVAQGLAAAAAPIILAAIITAYGAPAGLIFCGVVSCVAVVAMVLLFRHATHSENGLKTGS